MTTVPEKYKEEFDRSALFAVTEGEVTPTSLSKHLGVSVLVASIMVGFLEKAGLVSEGKNDDVRKANITLEEWNAYGRRAENIPRPEKSAPFMPEVKVIEEEKEPLPDYTFKKGRVAIEENVLIFGEHTLPIIEISTVYFRKGSLFKRSALVAERDGEAPCRLTLSKDERERAKEISIIIDKFIKKEYNIGE